MRRERFYEHLRLYWEKSNFLLVGLDPDLALMPRALLLNQGRHRQPGEVLVDFSQQIIGATSDSVAGYKIQLAHWLRWWQQGGIEALEKTLNHLRYVTPRPLCILDAKVGDIDATNQQYAEAFLTHPAIDAITVTSYSGGMDAFLPFLDHQDRGSFFVCRTSDTSPDNLQTCRVVVSPQEVGRIHSYSVGDWSKFHDGELPNGEYMLQLYKVVAARVQFVHEHNVSDNCGLVMAAQYPEAAAAVRAFIGDDIPFLVPGIGAQGGDLSKAVKAARNSKGDGFLVTSSRGIIHHLPGALNFTELAVQEVASLNEQIRAYHCDHAM